MKGITSKRILITGGSGFIGHHLTQNLIDLNANVYVVSREDSGNLMNLEQESLFRIDVRDLNSVEKTINQTKPDQIIHLAASLDRSLTRNSARENFETNMNGTMNLLSAARDDIERFVFLSTSDVYDPIHPPFSEDHNLSPNSPYSASKICAEIACRLFFRSFETPIVIIRPFIVYGPNQRKGMLIPDMIMSILEGCPFSMTKGEQSRDFVFVEDVVQAILLASVKKKAIGRTFNVCTGKETKIKDVAEKIGNLAEAKEMLEFGKMAYRENEIWRHFGNRDKIRKLLGWEPRTSLEEGLKKTVKWYSENRDKWD